MYQAMADAIKAAEADSKVRVLLIHGKSDLFTAGNDLQDFLDNPSARRKPAGVPVPATASAARKNPSSPRWRARPSA